MTARADSMGLFSGTRLSDRDVDVKTQKRIRQIVQRLWLGQIDPDDAIRQLTDLVVRATNAKQRVQTREGLGHMTDADGQPITAENLSDVAEMLWVVIANVSGGDWSHQTPEWQEAASRWRDRYFEIVGKAGTE